MIRTLQILLVILLPLFTWGQAVGQAPPPEPSPSEGAVFLLASGGVDSTVAAVLIARALGPERLHLLHIDNGLMRKNESAEGVEANIDLNANGISAVIADDNGDIQVINKTTMPLM